MVVDDDDLVLLVPAFLVFLLLFLLLLLLQRYCADWLAEHALRLVIVLYVSGQMQVQVPAEMGIKLLIVLTKDPANLPSSHLKASTQGAAGAFGEDTEFVRRTHNMREEVERYTDVPWSRVRTSGWTCCHESRFRIVEGVWTRSWPRHNSLTYHCDVCEPRTSS